MNQLTFTNSPKPNIGFYVDKEEREGLKKHVICVAPEQFSYDFLDSNKIVYEFWDCKDKMMKVAADIDCKNDDLDADEVLETVVNYFNENLCPCKLGENVNVMEDIREGRISFHITIINYKTTVGNMQLWAREHKKAINELVGCDCFDSSVYRNGVSKIRTYHGKKADSNQNGFKPYKNYNDDMAPLDMLFQYVTDDMETFEHVKHKKPVGRKQKKKEEADSEEYDVMLPDDEYLQYIDKMLTIVKQDRAESYEDCYKAGRALKLAFGEMGKSVFEKFLRRSTKYSREFMESKWNETINKSQADLFTCRNIIAWAREDDYNEFLKQSSNFEQNTLGIEFSDYGIAKFAEKMADNRFIWGYRDEKIITDTNMYCYDDEFKIWKNYGKNNKSWSPIFHFFQKEVSDEMNRRNNEINGKAKDVHEILSKHIKSFLHNLKYLNNVVENFKTVITATKPVVFDTHEEMKSCLNFQNGILEMKKIIMDTDGQIDHGYAFRERVKEDYITQILPYDFDEDHEKDSAACKDIIKIMSDIHTNEEDRKFAFEWMAYNMTGEILDCEALFKVGYSGANGKTLETDIFTKCLPIYVQTLCSDAFRKDSKKQHKDFACLYNSISRMIVLNEMGDAKNDSEMFKAVCEGKFECNLMYGTKVKIEHQGKINVTTNNDPVFEKVDGGTDRRGGILAYESKFCRNEAEAQKYRDLGVKNVFIRDATLIKKFDDDEYKNAFIHVMMPYIYNYYNTEWSMPTKYTDRFVSTCAETDEFKNAFDECFIITGDDEDRITKDDFCIEMKNRLQTFKYAAALQKFKTPEYSKVRYEKGWRKDGVRGVIVGLKLVGDEEGGGLMEPTD